MDGHKCEKAIFIMLQEVILLQYSGSTLVVCEIITYIYWFLSWWFCIDEAYFHIQTVLARKSFLLIQF